ncbi:MAG: fumarylacetoacetate hydrolase family protein [Burkholderiaceae bacterium]
MDGGATVAYPPQTTNYHYEVGAGDGHRQTGFPCAGPIRARELIYGLAAGLDMTRRDLQLVARDKGRPWDLGKDIEDGSVCGEIVPMEGVVIEQGAIALEVNGATKRRRT